MLREERLPVLEDNIMVMSEENKGLREKIDRERRASASGANNTLCGLRYTVEEAN